MEAKQGMPLIPKLAQAKVASACKRCRKQKLKCDVHRPCTLCTRAGAECVAVQPEKWKAYQFEQGQRDAAKSPKAAGQPRSSKRSRTSNDGADDNNERIIDYSIPTTTSEAHASPAATSVSSSNTQWKSSSTIGLVEEAFHHYDADAPEDSKTSAFAARQWRRTVLSETDEETAHRNPLQGLLFHHWQATSNRKSKRVRVSEQAADELASLLPGFNTVSLLVDNYFDRIHWFTLLFHQDDFRRRFRDLYPDSKGPPSANGNNVGYLSVLLAVCAISLEHLSVSQNSVLDQAGVDAQAFQDKILSTLRVRLLDMLSLGSLETVQTCVLLGTYYLNQGEPELAWPLCGCGLRIAQALNLHRNLPLPESAVPDQLTRFRHVAEARKRCWWAIYEFETLCSLIYGFPLSISDEDCDVEPLDAHDEYSGSARGVSANEPTLLSYKCAMSELSRIVRSAIKDLYGSRRNPETQGGQSTPLQSVVQQVALSDSRILSWYGSLPSRLRLGHLTQQSSMNPCAGPKSSRADSAKEFEDHLFQLQALTLKLAYENTRILIHRPLLSYKFTGNHDRPREVGFRPNSFQSSISACRYAALQVSRLGSAHIFNEVSETYAVAFVALHLLTAGIALCIMTNLDPLSEESHESKVAVHRLMGMQNELKSKSIVAAQGLDILGQLMSLVMAKEMQKVFEFVPDKRSKNDPRTESRTARQEAQHLGRPSVDFASRSGAKAEMTQSLTLEGTRTEDDSTGPAPTVHEDLVVSQTLHDFEQAMMDASENALFGGTSDLETSEFWENGYVGQDQGWIWGSDYGL